MRSRGARVSGANRHLSARPASKFLLQRRGRPLRRKRSRRHREAVAHAAVEMDVVGALVALVLLGPVGLAGLVELLGESAVGIVGVGLTAFQPAADVDRHRLGRAGLGAAVADFVEAEERLALQQAIVGIVVERAARVETLAGLFL